MSRQAELAVIVNLDRLDTVDAVQFLAFIVELLLIISPDGFEPAGATDSGLMKKTDFNSDSAGMGAGIEARPAAAGAGELTWSCRPPDR